ncbi:MAG: AraC family transcriptional regulator ligand-binding domain-containing protein [Pseudomonadota bacterium]
MRRRDGRAENRGGLKEAASGRTKASVHGVSSRRRPERRSRYAAAPCGYHGFRHHFATDCAMRAPMVNIAEFAEVVGLLDRLASPRIVDRALRAAGLTRKVLHQGAGFLPYRLEAQVVEHAARALGDARLGARLAEAFDYQSYDAYARFVLSAPDLGAALSRGRKAFPLIHPGSEIVLERRERHLVVSRRTPLGAMVGHQHLDDGAVLLIADVVRRFLGARWRPSWIELTSRDAETAAYLESATGAPSRLAAGMPGVAVPLERLTAANPTPPDPRLVVGLMDLPALMGVELPRTTSDAVRQVLQTQFVLGDLSEDGVAGRLAIGRRTLQRALQAEGTTFRNVKARFLETRARTLLRESDWDIPTIAGALGYKEPKSFRRAFRNWTGVWPDRFRAEAR